MASVYERYYERQPPAVKVIAVAGVALVGYSVYRSIKRAADEKRANQAAELLGNDLTDLSNQGVNPSYSDSQFEVYCQTLEQAMNGCGANMNMIRSVFHSMQNEADIRKLITQFAVRYYTPCIVSDPFSYTIWLVNNKAFGGSLITWLTSDLSSHDLAELNGILSGKGIAFQIS